MQTASPAPARPCRFGLLCLLTWFLSAPFGESAHGQAVVQGGRLSPREHYAFAMNAYEAGDFEAALQRFRLGARSTLRTTGRPWVDSICFYAMIGECHAQLGQLDEALLNYNTALRIHLGNADWLLHAQFDPKVTLEAANRNPKVPWGKTKRLSRRATLPSEIPVAIAVPASLTGEWIAVRIPEQIRCLAICLMGRREILGPVARFDPFTKTLLDELSLRRVRRGHWSEVWLDLLLGLAFETQGNLIQAKSHLEQAIVMDDVFDHHLTATALLALGRLAAQEGRPIEAGRLFEEATYSAYGYEDIRVLTEAFRRAQSAGRQVGGGDGYAPLQVAEERIRRTGPALLHVELLLALAQDHLQSMQVNRAQGALRQLRSIVGRLEGRSSVLANRLAYLEAVLAFEQADVQKGHRLLKEAVETQKTGSPRRYQKLEAGALARGNPSRISTSDARRLFAEVLSDPSPADWLDDPLDSLSSQTDFHEDLFGQWFELAWSRRDDEQAFDIVERIRRHRFLAGLPFAGRFLGLQWLLDVPEDSLDDDRALGRRDFLLRFPEYVEAIGAWEKNDLSLSQMPFSPSDPAQQRRQRKLLEEQAELQRRRETLLQAVALLPEPAVSTFPPQISLESLKERLGPTQGLWSFYRTSKGLYSFFVTHEGLSTWEIERPEDVAEQTKRLLRAMGHVEGNRPLTRSTLESDAWVTQSQELLRMLVGRHGSKILEKIEELVVVPDGVLWFVPFEALTDHPGGSPDGIDTLIGQRRLRYAPTASLAVGGLRREGTNDDTTLVVGGSLHPREPETMSERLFQRLGAKDPNASFLPLPRRTDAAQRMGLAGRVVIWDEIGFAELTALARGQALPKKSLALPRLPWRGPLALVIPGLRTPVEDALREADLAALSDQMYQTTMHLLAAGPRSILLSRWRVGGESTARLIQEFAQELPYTSPPEAWQRAVLLSAKRPLVPADEPRLSLEQGEDAPSPRHPFFWSGFLLIDRGPPPTP